MGDKAFIQRVYSLVHRIPKGKVATYKQIAKLAGNSKAARVIGIALKHNPDLKNIPCHRVVGSDGSLCGYSAGEGIKTKKELLLKEGVVFKKDKVLLSCFQWFS